MTIRPALPTFRGPNYYVPELFYASDVGMDGLARVDLGVPATLDADGILDGQDIAVAGTATTFAAAYVALLAAAGAGGGMARYGRNVTVIASGAATSKVYVRGTDYLGQYVHEEFTLNGANSVVGKKAFYRITSVQYDATAATTIDVGWGSALGLPYRAVAVDFINELVSGAKPANAGAVIAGADPATTQTATSADPRGTYTAHSGNPPNGVRSFVLTIYADIVNGLHGIKHYYS